MQAVTEQYLFRESYRGPRRVKPDVVAAELQFLRDSGGVTADRAVQAATPDVAPLHPEFTWDDEVCGREYRLEQARRLIRGIVVIDKSAEKDDREPRSVYVHVPAHGAKGPGKYEPLATVANNADEYERALTEARRYLDSAESRFHELRRLAEARGGKTEALAIAIQGFAAVKEAIELLK